MQLTAFEDLERQLADFNLGYLQIAVAMVRADLPAAAARLDIPFDLCRLLERLTHSEISALARSPEVLMAPRSTEALRARLTTIRQGAEEITPILDVAQPLWEGERA